MSGIYIPHKGDVEGAIYMVAVVGGRAYLYTYRYGEPNMVYIKDGIIVKGHGRLVDADALLSQYKGDIWTAKTDYAEGLRDVAKDIADAPTIIPADKEGEG